MTRREAALDALVRHSPQPGPEAEHAQAMLAFAQAHEEPFDRRLLPGHLVASGLVTSPRLDRVLLLHHRKLDRWLQCGGHAEPGDGSPRATALREAQEETGLEDLEPHPSHPGLLDVDVHEIPATDELDAHLHMDLRYLLVADPDARLDPPAREVKGIGWFTWEEVDTLALDEGLQRLLGKIRALA